jgi:hypothetical protein
MTVVSQDEPKTPRRQRSVGGVALVGFLALTLMLMFVVSTVVIEIVHGSFDVKGAVGLTLYFSAAVVLPIVVGRYIYRSRGKTLRRSVLVAAAICLAVNLLLVPIVVIAMAM